MRPIDDGSIGLVLSSHAPACRFPEGVFELPIQVDGRRFPVEARRFARTRIAMANGSCTEAIATSYHADHYWPLKTATAVTLHFPWGPVPLSEAALAHLRRVTPARPAEEAPGRRRSVVIAINRLTMMLSAGQVGQARETAEGVAAGVRQSSTRRRVCLLCDVCVWRGG